MRKTSWLVVMAVCAMTASDARADEEGRERTLSGHRFVPFDLVEWGFVTTRFATIISGGIARFDIERPPLLPFGLGTRTSSGSVAANAVTVRFEAKVAPWFGVGGRVTTTMITATDSPAALEVGAAGANTFELAAIARIVRTPRWNLAGRVELGAGPRYGLVPRRVLDSVVVVDGGLRFDSLTLVTDGHLLTLKPALAAAYALGPQLGLQASVAWEQRRNELADDSDWSSQLTAALGATLDIEPASLVVHAAAGFAYASSRDPALTVPIGRSAREPRALGELGVFYHGRPALDLGVSSSADLGGDGYRVVGNIKMAYYW